MVDMFKCEIEGNTYELEYFVNLDINNIVTPINVEEYEKLLLEHNYPKEQRQFLLNGFTKGFDIGYQGPKIRSSKSENIPFTIGNEAELWNKVMKEVKLGRYAGPFKDIPFNNFIQSPIGLVPKEGGKKTRLIFHLSYDFGIEEESLNYFTPEELRSVKYKDLDHAVRLSLELKNLKNRSKLQEDDDNISDTEGIFYGKTYLTSAFRILPLSPDCFYLLIMKAKESKNRQVVVFH